MPDPLTDAENFPYGKIDASGQPMEVNDIPLPDAPEQNPDNGEQSDGSASNQEPTGLTSDV